MNYLPFGKSYIKNQTALQPISVIKFPNLFQPFMSDAIGFFAKSRKDHAEIRIFTFQKHWSEIIFYSAKKNEQNIYICHNDSSCYIDYTVERVKRCLVSFYLVCTEIQLIHNYKIVSINQIILF